MRSRLDRAIDKRDDLEDHLSKWAFGMTPSDRRWYERRIVKAQARVDRLERPTHD